MQIFKFTNDIGSWHGAAENMAQAITKENHKFLSCELFESTVRVITEDGTHIYKCWHGQKWSFYLADSPLAVLAVHPEITKLEIIA